MEIDYTQFGLNTYEAKAYGSLLKLGDATAPEISRESSVPYGRIYDTLHSLESKGFVLLIPGINKRFTITNPEILYNSLLEKKKDLDLMTSKLKEFKDIYKTRIKNPIKVAYGKKNFFRIVESLPNPTKYRYSIKPIAQYRQDWVDTTKQFLKKDVDLKILVDYNENTTANIKKWKRILPELKHFKNDSIAMSIIDDKVVMITLIKSNITLLIEEESFCKLMKQFYINTYKNSRPLVF